jgi:hypothetical protein
VNRRDRRRFYVVLGLIVGLLFAGGIVAAIVIGDEPICPDGKVPTAEAMVSLGRKAYMCQNGEIVTK